MPVPVLQQCRRNRSMRRRISRRPWLKFIASYYYQQKDYDKALDAADAGRQDTALHDAGYAQGLIAAANT